jgi:hypothetical protein
LPAALVGSNHFYLQLRRPDMRSEYVFAAAREIGNRFMLCRVTAVSARRLHIDSTQPSETINKSLKLIAAGDANSKPEPSNHSADAVAAGNANNQPDSPKPSAEAVAAG